MHKFYVELAVGLLSVVAGIFATRSAIIIAWYCLGFASVLLGLALHELMKLKGHQKLKRRAWAVALTLVLLLSSWYILGWLKPLVESPFRIEVPIIMRDVADSMLMTDLMFRHDNTTSPINFALYVQVVNMQTLPSKIAAYSVQAASSPDGPWKSLRRLPIMNGELLIMDRIANQARVLRPINDLADVLSTKAFDPRETRVGWEFFERRDINPLEVKFLKFYIRDTAGSETSQIIDVQKKGSSAETNFQTGSLIFTGKRIDISKLTFGYYYSSYPHD